MTPILLEARAHAIAALIAWGVPPASVPLVVIGGGLLAILWLLQVAGSGGVRHTASHGARGTAPRSSRSPASGGSGDTAGDDTTTPRGASGGRMNGALPVQDVAQVATTGYRRSASFWAGIVAVGNVVMLHGAPKAGKSTWLTCLEAAVVAGEPYMGEATAATSIVVVSEELPAVFQGKARRLAGGVLPPCPWHEALLPPGPLCYSRTPGTSRQTWWMQRRPIAWAIWRWQRTWLVRTSARLRRVRRVWHIPIPLLSYRVDVDTLPRLVTDVERFARSVGARIVVYDTLKAIAATAITSVSHAEAFIQEMKGSAARGFCPIVVHHDKEDGTMQGPKNLYGGVDFDLHQRAPKGSREGDTTREIVATGRFDRLAPDPWVYRMDKETGQLEQIGGALPESNRSVAIRSFPSCSPNVRGVEPLRDDRVLNPPRRNTPVDSVAPLPLPVLTPPLAGHAAADTTPDTTPSPILTWLTRQDTTAALIPSRVIYDARAEHGQTERACKVQLKNLWLAGKVERQGAASQGYAYRPAQIPQAAGTLPVGSRP